MFNPDQDLFKELIQYGKKQGATEIEIGCTEHVGLSVTVRNQAPETLEYNRDKNVGITVYINHKKGVASTNDLRYASLKQAIDSALSVAKYAEADPFSGLPDRERLAYDYPDLKLSYPWEMDSEYCIEQAKRAESAGLQSDARIKQCDGATFSASQSLSILANSHDFVGFFPSSYYSLSCVMIGEDKAGMERDYDYTCHRDILQLASPSLIGQMAAKKTMARLSPQKLPSQVANVMFMPSVARGIFSHCFSAISGGTLFRKTSFLLDSLEKKIFPDFITIHENPHLMHGLASAPFDGEGIKTTSKNIIEAGVVKSYLLSTYSARKLGMQSTGNAGGVHNASVSSTGESFEGLLKKLNRGLLVTELMGQGVNLVTGDYSRGASGFWVENGEIAFPVAEITIAGNLKNMFQNIVAVGNDIDYRSGLHTGSMIISDMTIAGT
jgi:PmbA protein